MASNLAPPCPGCGRTGRKNEQARSGWKFRCVNMFCDVMCYSLQDAVDGEAFRLGKAPQPPISSRKIVQRELDLTVLAPLFKDSTTTPSTGQNDGSTGGVAGIEGASKGHARKRDVA